MMIARMTFIVLLAALSSGRAEADEGESVLVTTIPARSSSMPDIVTAYGTAAPALDSSMTVSLQSQGRILNFDVTAGEEVKAGQPLLRFEISQSALGSFYQAQTAIQAAQIDRKRIAQLVAQQLATKDQLTQADKAIADAQNTFETLKRSGADKPELTIAAPFDGIVATIPVAQGDTIAPGAPMMTLMRADGLVVKVGIEPAQRPRLKKGDVADLVPLTAGGPSARGTVVRIDGLLNPKTHLIDTDVATSARILPGAVFEARIVVGLLKGYMVPRDAIVSDATGEYVFQVDGTKARRVDVTLGGENGPDTIVTGKIDPAQTIVVKGNNQLTEGMAVRQADAAVTDVSGTP